MSKLLDQVSSPEDLKDFSYDQLNTLSEEIREFLEFLILLINENLTPNR